MKFKHVFLVWFWADIFLGLGTLVFWVSTAGFKDFGDSNDFGMFILVTFYGILLSLPSLAVLLIFHAIYNANRKDESKDFRNYVIVVLSINAAYALLCLSAFDWGIDGSPFFLCTTIAGLLALFIIDKRIKKKKAMEPVEERNEEDKLNELDFR